MNMTELPKINLDLTLMANLQPNRVKSAHTKCTATHREEQERQRASVKFGWEQKRPLETTGKLSSLS